MRGVRYGGLQAADLPTKAPPGDYLKACGLYLRAPRPCLTSKKSN
jgi:hypothetical protein